MTTTYAPVYPAPVSRAPLSPSDVNAAAAEALADSKQLAAVPVVGVEGEVTNFRGPSKGGHYYFALKDEAAALPCVMWAGRAARANAFPKDRFKNGLKVVAYGEVRIWKKKGEFRLECDRVEEAGLGALWAKIEALRRKLRDEGLMDPARKRRLPAEPRRIGIATSRQGAVLHDVVQTLRKRFPLVTLVVRQIPVQGEGAGRAIAEGIAALAKRGRVDVILLCRGGGSAEDFLPFNEEVLARTIRAISERGGIPVVTGLGHALDRTIADDVADYAAAVPAAAAAAVVPDRYEILRAASDAAERMWRAARTRITALGARLDRTARSLEAASPRARLARVEERLERLGEALPRAARLRLERASTRCLSAGQRLADLSPLAVLGRGYAILFDENGRVVRAADAVRPDDLVEARLSKGRVRARVMETEMETETAA